MMRPLLCLAATLCAASASRGSDARGGRTNNAKASINAHEDEAASVASVRGSSAAALSRGARSEGEHDKTQSKASSSASSSSTIVDQKVINECTTSPEQKPNVLFILMDDLGWGDLSATTGQFPTPNMDSLYTNSLQINRHYIHLMCSPSRTQFMTGRYAMNLGFGEFFPWDDAEIGGIPIGQPTVANWLSQYGDYTTYGVGKWQLGYANERLTPLYNGFSHFFGFYQGAIDYVTKTYNDIEDGDIGVYDFFEDGDACYDIIESEENTMTLYGKKILEYLETEGKRAHIAKENGEQATPWYMYAALQSMHVPFPVIPEFEDQCELRVARNSGSKQWKNERKLYCELLFLTDRIVGDIMDKLKSTGLYDNTLVVFTADNGGETTRGASNYPFRGTKGEPFEGNTRVITTLAGGIIEKQGLFGQVREELVSNLDWTPTLLDFAGYLDCIDEADYTWDGISQKRMILGDNVGFDSDAERRRDLVINIGDVGLASARVMVEMDGKYYKYIKSDSTSAIDRWSYSPSFSDSWSEIEHGGKSLIRVTFDEQPEVYPFSQSFGDQLLFDVTSDEREMYNLLNPDLPHFDDELNQKVIAACEEVLEQWMADNMDEMFAAPIDFLHERLAVGDPSLVEDGRFVRPFLSDQQYQHMIAQMWVNEDAKGHYNPQGLKDVYVKEWVVPGTQGVAKGANNYIHPFQGRHEMEAVAEMNAFDVTGKAPLQWSVMLTMVFAVGAMLVAIGVIMAYHCNQGRRLEMAGKNAGLSAVAGYGSLVQVQ